MPSPAPSGFYATATAFFSLLLLLGAFVAGLHVLKQRRLQRRMRADAEYLLHQTEEEAVRAYAPHNDM